MGFLSAVGGLFQDDADRQAGNLNALQRFGDALNSNDYDTQAAQMQNDVTRRTLATLADQKDKDPQSVLAALAAVNPDYAVKAAALQAQNPLAALLRPQSQAAYNPAVSGPKDAEASPTLPWSTGYQGGQKASLANLTGDDLLKALPPAIASQVKGIADGTQQLPTGMGGAANRQALLQLVNQYDPSFDAVNYNARSATRKDFTSGKAAQNITALNTAIGHLSSLSDAYDKLGNTDYPLVNKVANAVENQFSPANQAATADVTSKAHAVSEELAKVFRSTGMAESDVKAWEKQIDTSSTPAQSKAVIDAALELMNSRLDALGQQYSQGMGKTKDGIELLSPKAQSAYQKLTGRAPAETTASGNLQVDNAANASQDPVAQAKAAGYTDAEIQAYLKKKGKK